VWRVVQPPVSQASLAGLSPASWRPPGGLQVPVERSRRAGMPPAAPQDASMLIFGWPGVKGAPVHALALLPPRSGARGPGRTRGPLRGPPLRRTRGW